MCIRDRYYGDISCIPADVGAAFTAVMNFYHCEKDNASQGGTTTNRRTQIYSFEHDAPYIYAAFLEQYGIDLTQENNLHWWRFKAMFDSLSEKTQFVKIMGYRSMTITKDMSQMCIRDRYYMGVSLKKKHIPYNISIV